MKLRILSFNIRYFNNKDGINHWDNRKDLCIKIILKNSPDIIGFQEVSFLQFCYLRNKLSEYEWCGIGRDEGNKGECTPIFYKNMDILEGDTFWLSKTPWKPSRSWGFLNRICTWTLLSLQNNNKKLLFMNTHLGLTPKARLNSIPLLLNHIEYIKQGLSDNKDLPVIITGDFNFSPKSKGYKKISKFLRDGYLEDAKNRKLPEKNYISFHNFTGRRVSRLPWLNRIDYAWISRSIKVERSFIIFDRADKSSKIYPSDHWPFFIEIEI